MPRAQIKDEKAYQELRKHGESKEKSARIANASAGQGRGKVAARGGPGGAYQDWLKADLLQRAREIGIKGRSSMTKAQLISACATTDRQERGSHVPTVRHHPSPSQRAGQSLPPALANVLGHLRDAAASHDGEYPGGFLPAAGSSAEADADRSAAGP